MAVLVVTLGARYVGMLGKRIAEKFRHWQKFLEIISFFTLPILEGEISIYFFLVFLTPLYFD
jgi:hypothetical protein